MPHKPALTVVGSINFDVVARVERFPEPGETILGLESYGGPGGKGGNQAVAAAILGADVRMVGNLGDDVFTEHLRSSLEDSGVDVAALEFDKGECGVAQILVRDDGENQIVVSPGANARLYPDADAVPAGSAVLSQLEIPLETVAWAAERAERFFLNAAPARPISATLVDRCELLVVNRHELDALPSTPALTALTLGEEGAVLLENGVEVARSSAPKVHAVDATAAGDAFTACLVVSLLEGRERDEALARACAAGAITASREGAQESLPWPHEIDEILGR